MMIDDDEQYIGSRAGTIFVHLGTITAIVNGSDNNYSSYRSSIIYGSKT